MATLQNGKCFTLPTFFGMCCRSEWQERMYIYKWHEVDQTKHEIFCVHIVCNEIQVKVNLEITTFFFYLRFPYCPNFFWFGVVVGSGFYFVLKIQKTKIMNNSIFVILTVKHNKEYHMHVECQFYVAGTVRLFRFRFLFVCIWDKDKKASSLNKATVSVHLQTRVYITL